MKLGGKHVVRCAESDVWRLFVIGDIHLGSRSCAVKRFQTTVAKVAEDPHALWIGLGDYAEYIGHRDIRFDPDNVSEQISVSDLGRLGRVYQDMFVDEVSCISDKCVGLLKGNHEDKYEKLNNMQGLHQETCDKLSVRNLGYSCFLDLVFKTRHNEYSFRIVAHHGAGWATTTGGKMNRLLKFMDSFPLADIFIMGHVHEKIQYSRPIISADAACENLVEILQLGVVSGSYLKTYSEGEATYGERAGYRPVALGSPAIVFHPSSRDLGVEW